MLTYVRLFLQGLAFSCSVEALVAFGVVFFLKKENRKGAVLVAIFGTALTIPYVWFVFPTLFFYSPILIIIIGETFAFVVEALIYKYSCNYSFKFAFFLSFIANIASYGLGLLLLK